jgi:hypothetical protein
MVSPRAQAAADALDSLPPRAAFPPLADRLGVVGQCAACPAPGEDCGRLQDAFDFARQGTSVALGAQFQPFCIEMIARVLHPVQELRRKTHECASCVFLRFFPAVTTGVAKSAIEVARFGIQHAANHAVSAQSRSCGGGRGFYSDQRSSRRWRPAASARCSRKRLIAGQEARWIICGMGVVSASAK